MRIGNLPIITRPNDVNPDIESGKITLSANNQANTSTSSLAGQGNGGSKSSQSVSQKQADIDYIYALFNEYSNAYEAEWRRLENCERLYHGIHWNDVPMADSLEPRPVTPIIQATIESVRAELTDWYPQAIVTADESEYSDSANALSAVIQENHIACDYEREYEKAIHDLLVGGTMVQEVGFDPDANFGLGAAYIRHVDNRCIMFDPNSSSVGDCRAIIKFSVHPLSWYYEQYPKHASKMVADEIALTEGSSEDSAVLIEFWKREYDSVRCRYDVHIIKVAGRVILEDSREICEQGLFVHGKYPFVVTTLFPRKGSVLGFGFCDVFEQQQRLSDKLDQIVIKNALMASHNKMLVSSASGFDVNDLCDWSKQVHTGENINGVKWFSTAPLPGYIIEYVSRMRDNVKEESGANEFSRGSTANGVTAASAIMALQEMSNKRSRMIAKSVHASFADAVRMEIEVEREYAVFCRPVYVNRIRVAYSNELLNDIDEYPLEFKISVKVQRESRFSVMAHNETIFKLVQSGMITPQIGLDMLIFDGKEEVIAKMQQARGEDGEEYEQE
ncbi:MAG: hypothetical protein GX802_05095 [Clostridiales bacterium]|nr:hypothetical protein [Clostridiales bacterium]